MRHFKLPRKEMEMGLFLWNKKNVENLMGLFFVEMKYYLYVSSRQHIFFYMNIYYIWIEFLYVNVRYAG